MTVYILWFHSDQQKFIENTYESKVDAEAALRWINKHHPADAYLYSIQEVAVQPDSQRSPNR